MTPDLFTPLTLADTEIPNRVMVSPMCQNTFAEYIQRKREYAKGPAGTLMCVYVALYR